MYDIPSCIREMPGPEEAVMANFPAEAAPNIMLMVPVSHSAWRNSLPNCGKYSAAACATSLAGVIG